LFRAQIRWALRNAAGVIAVSRRIEERIRQMTDLRPGRLTQVPCAGFDPDLFCLRSRPRDSLGLESCRHVVLFIGQLVPIKGIDVLIDAWGELRHRGVICKNDLLVLLGEGPERKRLEQQIQTTGVGDTVRLTGALSQSEVASWVAAANVLCLPSRNEGTPNVIVEALASGVPVVASAVGGVPDLIKTGENGFTVPPEDPRALSAALENALAREWDARRIRESVSHLTWRAIADRNFAFFKSIGYQDDPAS
jgi:glycosyltransferase involved in cell wall biosynthesis